MHIHIDGYNRINGQMEEIMANIDYSALKKGGFMRQKQKGYFSLRIQVVGVILHLRISGLLLTLRINMVRDMYI